MSRSEQPAGGPSDPSEGTIVARRHERLDFQAERDAGSTSWQRADPRAALVERWGRYGYLVTLLGGSAHFCALGRRDEALRGFCKCKGFRYNDGPCAHLCTVRKAAFAGLETIDGDPVEIPPLAEGDLVDEEHTAAQVSGEVFDGEGSRAGTRERARRAPHDPQGGRATPNDSRPESPDSDSMTGVAQTGDSCYGSGGYDG